MEKRFHSLKKTFQNIYTLSKSYNALIGVENMNPQGKNNNQCNHKEHGTYKIGPCKRKKIKQILLLLHFKKKINKWIIIIIKNVIFIFWLWYK